MTTMIEVRRWSPGGAAYRTVPLKAVEAEVAVLAGHPATTSVEVRAVGADLWRRVA